MMEYNNLRNLLYPNISHVGLFCNNKYNKMMKIWNGRTSERLFMCVLLQEWE